MGADLITLGYTAVHRPPSPSDDEVAALVQTHADALRQNRVQATGSALGEDYFDTDADYLAAIVTGALVVRDARNGVRYQSIYGFEVNGEDRDFVLLGGTSWGEVPFDGYDQVGLFLESTRVVPELGAALGVLGVGIITESEV